MIDASGWYFHDHDLVHFLPVAPSCYKSSNPYVYHTEFKASSITSTLRTGDDSLGKIDYHLLLVRSTLSSTRSGYYDKSSRVPRVNNHFRHPTKLRLNFAKLFTQHNRTWFCFLPNDKHCYQCVSPCVFFLFHNTSKTGRFFVSTHTLRKLQKMQGGPLAFTLVFPGCLSLLKWRTVWCLPTNLHLQNISTWFQPTSSTTFFVPLLHLECFHTVPPAVWHNGAISGRKFTVLKIAHTTRITLDD